MKRIATAIFVIGVLIGSQRAFAATTEELQRQLNALLAQLQQLQQLQALRAAPSTSTGYSTTGAACVTLQENLSLRYPNRSAVTQLQTFLQSRSEAGWPSGVAATGVFGFVTKNAVMRLQVAHTIPSTGFVGPATRSLIEQLSCGRAAASPSYLSYSPPPVSQPYYIPPTTAPMPVAPQSQFVPPAASNAPVPLLTLTANTATVLQGASVTLSWNSQNTDGCAASGAWSGPKNLNGSEIVIPSGTGSTYALRCTGAGGQSERSVFVQVSAPQPAVTFTVSTSSISEGGSAVVTWNATNAAICTASGAWAGAKGGSGSETVAPTSTAAYALTCTNGTAAANAVLTISVIPRPRAAFAVHALILDGVPRTGKVELPLQEAIRFIEQFSRFRITYGITESQASHGYTHYDCDAGAQACVIVNYTDVSPQSVIEGLSTADSYVLFWNTGTNTPLHAGSAWWPEYGIPKEGRKRPYATIPGDPWWYNTDPFQGFSTRAAQIITHELINTLGFTLTDRAPAACPPLHATDGDPAYKYESDKLKTVTDECYRQAFGI